ncbi:MAG: beta strand repeat-containing protein [Limisphaerales bacterium]
MTEFLSRRRVLALLSALVFGLARQGSAQSNAITDYTDLVNALNTGITTITNFQTITPTTTIYLTTVGAPTIQITNNVTINAGSNSVIFQGNGTNGGTRFFHVHPNASLTLNNLELIGGGSTNGGAIYNEGTLIISNCLLTGNYATNTNGVIGGSGPLGLDSNGTNGGNGGLAAGGAIYSTGPVMISYSILSNNFAEAGNGGNGGNAGGAIGNGGNAGYGGNAYGGALYSTGSNNVFYMTEFAENECAAGYGGVGGSYATNSGPLPPSGAGGAAGLGGSCAGGAAFVTGPFYMTNCLFFGNVAVGGSTGPAEVDSDFGGADGSPGGSALGGALFMTNGVADANIENTIFFVNACYGGYGGNTAVTNATGGTGGDALGGGVWSAAALTQMSFCTLATNSVFGGTGGTNTAGVTNSAGAASGYMIYQSAGVCDLGASILAGNGSVTSGSPLTPPGAVGVTTSLNAVGVTDAGYNISSDASPAKSAVLTTTKLNTNPDLNSGLTAVGPAIGGTLGSQPMLTLQILGGSPAAGFVYGVPGSTFPATDEVLQDRGTPASAGAYELNPITISINAVLPTISSIGPATNLTGVGDTVVFTVVASSSSSQSFGYQWQLDGTNIFDSANYSGTASNILTVKKITIADEGEYTVLVSPTTLEGPTNYSSGVLLILTNPPVIKGQPVSQLGRPVGSIVTFTVNVGPYPQGYYYQWLFGSTPLTNLEGGNIFITNNVLTINPALMSDEGSYSVIVSNGFNSIDYGVKTSAVVRLTLVPDHTRPTVTITSPPANSRTNTMSTLNIAGTAADNAQVIYVRYWFTNFNAGLNPAVTTNVYGYATLTTNGGTNLNGPDKMLWSITNLPLPGTNILAVQSVDYSSNVSTVATRRFFYQVPTNFTLTIVSNGGGGTVTNHAFIKGDASPSNNASLNIGEGYSLVAAPNSTSLLGSWTITSAPETNVVVTNGNTLKFIMESNTSIQALFVSNVFLQAGVHGTYNGLFAVPEIVTNQFDTNEVVTNQIYLHAVAFESSGMLDNLVVGKKGSFSGKLLLGGGSYSLNGAFDAFGYASNSIMRSAALGGPLIVEMNVDTNGAGIITGTVSNVAWPTNAYLWADLAAATPGITNYTLLICPTTNTMSPTGLGYGLIADNRGTVTLSGGLPDGTTFSQTVPASQSNNIPVYVSLYSKTGFLFGWLNLTNLEWNLLTWIKETPTHPTLLFPIGFTNMMPTACSTWTNPGVIMLSSSNTLVISNADLNLDYTVAIDEPNKLVNASNTPPNSLTGTINLKTGLANHLWQRRWKLDHQGLRGHAAKYDQRGGLLCVRNQRRIHHSKRYRGAIPAIRAGGG